MTVLGSTKWPGRITIFSTRHAVCAGIQRMSKGTRVPRPRTSRSMGPRLTTSVQTVPRSTEGAAGRRRERASVTPAMKTPRPGEEARKAHGDSRDKNDGHRDVYDSLDFLGAGVRWSLYVHKFEYS